jgi:hypothetical protein
MHSPKSHGSGHALGRLEVVLPQGDATQVADKVNFRARRVYPKTVVLTFDRRPGIHSVVKSIRLWLSHRDRHHDTYINLQKPNGRYAKAVTIPSGYKVDVTVK